MKVFVILGNDCNLQCVYCCQRQIKERQIPRHISPKFWEYFHSIPPKTPVVFFGGEPLLYFGAIKEIVSHRSDLKYAVITNGKLLDKEKVDWFNEYDIPVTVSWDGSCSSYTRGYDALKENSYIKDVKNLSVSTVISKWSSPRDVVETAHEYLGNKEYGINFELPLMFSDTPSEYEQVDTKKLYQDMRYLTDRYISLKADRGLSILMWSILNTLKTTNVYGNKCGNGTRVINIDLSGNFYNCHNESKPGEYTEEWDKTFKRQNSMCSKCDLKFVCGGGCSLMSDEATKRRCDITRAYYKGVIDVLVENYGGVSCYDTPATTQPH